MMKTRAWVFALSTLWGCERSVVNLRTSGAGSKINTPQSDVPSSPFLTSGDTAAIASRHHVAVSQRLWIQMLASNVAGKYIRVDSSRMQRNALGRIEEKFGLLAQVTSKGTFDLEVTRLYVNGVNPKVPVIDAQNAVSEYLVSYRPSNNQTAPLLFSRFRPDGSIVLGGDSRPIAGHLVVK